MQIFKTTLFFCLLSSFTSLFAQQQQLKINPIGVFDPMFPKLLIGYERISTNGLGLEVELGRFFTNPLNEVRQQVRGWQGNLEMRKYWTKQPGPYHFINRKSPTLYFVGLELMLTRRYHTFHLAFVRESFEQVSLPITSYYQRLVGKYGISTYYRDKVLVEAAVLLGISRDQIWHRDPTLGLQPNNFLVPATERLGSRTGLYAGINLRIGLQLKKT